MELYPIITDPFHERMADPVREQAPRSPERNINMYMLLTDLMLWLSLTEGKSKRRTARKALIMSRWMQLSGDKSPSLGAFLL